MPVRPEFCTVYTCQEPSGAHVAQASAVGAHPQPAGTVRGQRTDHAVAESRALSVEHPPVAMGIHMGHSVVIYGHPQPVCLIG